MAASDILREAEKLRVVSDSLNKLAAARDEMSEPLTVLAATVRQSAAMLEVMVEVRMGGAPDHLSARPHDLREKRSN